MVVDTVCVRATVYGTKITVLYDNNKKKKRNWSARIKQKKKLYTTLCGRRAADDAKRGRSTRDGRDGRQRRWSTSSGGYGATGADAEFIQRAPLEYYYRCFAAGRPPAMYARCLTFCHPTRGPIRRAPDNSTAAPPLYPATATITTVFLSTIVVGVSLSSSSPNIDVRSA